MAYCSSCGAELPANAKFCSSCGASLNHKETPKQTLHFQQDTPYSPKLYVKNVQADLKECPECGRMTDSLKSYALFEKCVFLICYISFRRVQYTCCPDCMRKHLIEKGILTSNVITANFFWLMFILPLTIIELYLCSKKGHSEGV